VKTPSCPHYASLAFALAAVLAIEPAAGDTPSTDTSGWKCMQCPFLQGADTETEVGALVASGANASYGRYTGIDHTGTYVDAGASGQLRTDGGSYANYDLERLGLPSRDGYVEGGREGRYDLRLSYDGQPTRLYDTAVTPFQGSGATLTLPPTWMAAGSTGAMTQLKTSLAPVDLGYDRRLITSRTPLKPVPPGAAAGRASG
jgi:hypothetical protein